MAFTGNFSSAAGKTFLSVDLAFLPESGFTVQIFRFYWNTYLLETWMAAICHHIYATIEKY